ncbi:MAG: hypothetical protein EA402_03165 [Planctomycetota bacterium]|nr:MAG: hypothetical protein EA402_03165 [Planctomycetota bacterium]
MSQLLPRDISAGQTPVDHLTGAWHGQQAAAAEALAKAASRRSDLIALLRFGVLVALILSIAAVAGSPGAGPILAVAAFAGCWLLSGLWHGAVSQARDAARRLQNYHQHGIGRCEGPWPGPLDQRVAPASAASDHSYAHDLDVVGSGGLLERLDTCATAVGRQYLRQLLLDADGDWSPARRETVRALSTLHHWRAQLPMAASPRVRGSRVDIPQAIAWAQAQVASAEPPAVWPGFAVLLLSAVFIALIWLAGAQIGIAPAVAVAVITIAIGHRLSAHALHAAQLASIDADHEWDALTGLRQGMAHISKLAEQGSDLPPSLVAALATAEEGDRGLAEGERIFSALARRANPLWTFGPGALFCSGFHLARRARRWAQVHGQDMGRWQELLGRIDADASLATWAAEQSGSWPEILDAQQDPQIPLFAAKDMVHPLLPQAQAVGNDCCLMAGQALVLTGANASGKSTWLRTIGLNLLLARAGTTVTARGGCRLQPMRLATVMRVHDDLAAGRSRFQAEVARLAQALGSASGGILPSLLIFDEILGGTNSAERHAGTQAIIAERLRSQAPGLLLVATHDLALAQLAEAFPQAVQLAHFADDADADSQDLAFDYVLRPGVIQSTNALRVMRAAGLKV